MPEVPTLHDLVMVPKSHAPQRVTTDTIRSMKSTIDILTRERNKLSQENEDLLNLLLSILVSVGGEVKIDDTILTQLDKENCRILTEYSAITHSVRVWLDPQN